MLPALTIDCPDPAQLARFGCAGVDWRTDRFCAHAYLHRDGHVGDPVVWIGDVCWPITAGADRGEPLGRPWWSSSRPALPAAAGA